VSESDTRILELEAKLADFSAALGRERAERERASHERDEYKKLYELVMLELERVKRHLRAQNKSERVDAHQVQLAFAQVAKLVVPPALAQAIADQENEQASRPTPEASAPRGPHGRGKVPEQLPIERIELEPPEALRSCACCGQAKVKIGEETTSRLDYRPASLVHVQIARMKYGPSCKCEEGGVVIASVPDAAPVDRGLAGPGLLAHVVVSKYADHLPLNRLEEIFDRQGVHIARSTMCDWVEQVADLLGPITDAMAKASLGAHRIHTDDTGIPILAPGSTHKGHVWVYVADDDYVVFRYTPRRKSDGPREFLKGYTGYVQADAANLYDRLFGDEGAADNEAATEVGCWAHARRRFFDAQLTDRERALIGLGFIKKLYEADRVVMKMPPVRRTAERHRLCTPVLDAFKVWLDAEALVVLPKAPIAEAIGYARNQWGALTRFVEDARLKLDNNIAERQLRRVAVGRKNWLFAGSENGAERGCVLYSLLATCKLHGVNPFDYLRDVIMRVGTHPARDVLELSPKAWKQKLQNSDAARSAPPPAA
jgi:transposase